MVKKILIVGIVLLVVMLSFSFISAADDYGKDVNLGWEKFKLMFTFNQEKKAAKELELANAMLVRAQKMAEKGNLEAMEQAQKNYENLMEKSQSRVEKLKEAQAKKGIISDAVQIIEIEKRIELAKQKIEILKNKTENSNFTDEKKESINKIIEKMENRTEKFSEISDDKKEKLKEKLISKENYTEEEAEDEIEKIETDKNLSSIKKIVAENRIKNTEDALEKLQEKTSRYNLTVVNSQIAEVQTALTSARELYQNGSYQEVIDLLKPYSNYGRNLKEIISSVKEKERENKDKKANKTENSEEVED